MSLIAVALATFTPQGPVLVTEGKSLPNTPIKFSKVGLLLDLPGARRSDPSHPPTEAWSVTDVPPTGVRVLVFESQPCFYYFDRSIYNIDQSEHDPSQGPIRLSTFVDMRRLNLESVLSTATTTHKRKRLLVQWNITHGSSLAETARAVGWCYASHKIKNSLNIEYIQTDDQDTSWRQTFGISGRMRNPEVLVYICEGKTVKTILKNIPMTVEGGQTLKAAVDKAC